MTFPASPGAAAPQRPDYIATGWTGGRNPWVIVLVVTMATFMEYLDTSIANVALPKIAGSFGVSQSQGTWVLSSYLVANAVILPISGWLSTRLGRKRFYMGCVALFTVASALCGLAPTLLSLIVCRIFQGLGGGGLGPSEQAILADTFPPGKRSSAMALYGVAVVLAPAIGPTLGGFITDHWSWRWVFFINVPVGVASLALSSRIVTDPPHIDRARQVARPIDWPGLSLVVVGLGCLEIVLDKGQEVDWFTSPWIRACSITAAVALVSFVCWEARAEAPIVDLTLYRRKNFASASALMLGFGAILFSSTVLLPQYMQTMMGYTAQQAGMALSPGGLLVIFFLPLVAALASRIDARKLVTVGIVISSASLFYVARTLNQQIDFGTLVWMRALQSAGLAFLFVPVQTVAYIDMPLDSYGQVSGLVNLARYLGGAVGIASVTALVSRRAQSHQAVLSAKFGAFAPMYKTKLAIWTQVFQARGQPPTEAARSSTVALYHHMVQQATELAYLDAFLLLGALTVAMLPVVWLARRQAPGMPSGAA